MKKKYSFQKWVAICICTLLFNNYIQAQNIFPSTGAAGIGTTSPDASSILDMVSTSKGMLVPRMTKNQRDAIATPATGLLIYVTNGIPGFYYYNGTAWTTVTPKAGWLLTGNAGTNPAINFIGTADAQPLVFKVNSQKAGYLGTNSTGNTAFGYQTLYSNITGVDNTANGLWSLLSNTVGYYNTATGGFSLFTNSDGVSNTANGISALRFNTHGSDNTALGANTLFNNTTGYSNVAVGSNALFNNTTGYNNVAVGDSALYNQHEGDGNNTAIGSKALYSNTLGDQNIANGYKALFNNIDGGGNSAFGYQALSTNISGAGNTVIGAFADANDINYVNSSAFGEYSLITADDQVRIGNGITTSIGGYRSWTTLPSDKRVKKNIKENVPGLAFINKLKPVTYTIDFTAIDNIVKRPVIKDKEGKTIQPSQQELDSRKANEQIVFTGFVAQDVEAAASSIHYDFSGVDKPKNDKDLYGLRYSDFVMPLVKAVQELSAANDSLKKQNEEQQNINIDLQNRLAKLEAVMNVHQSTTNLSSASLDQNVPNPFSKATTINYSLPQKYSSAKIIVIDESGNTIQIFNLSGTGKSAVNFSPLLKAGVSYRYSLLIDGKLIDTKQMVLTK
jgi:hypothetical protein